MLMAAMAAAAAAEQKQSKNGWIGQTCSSTVQIQVYATGGAGRGQPPSYHRVA